MKGFIQSPPVNVNVCADGKSELVWVTGVLSAGGSKAKSPRKKNLTPAKISK